MELYSVASTQSSYQNHTKLHTRLEITGTPILSCLAHISDKSGHSISSNAPKVSKKGSFMYKSMHGATNKIYKEKAEMFFSIDVQVCIKNRVMPCAFGFPNRRDFASFLGSWVRTFFRILLVGKGYFAQEVCWLLGRKIFQIPN
jgi:hypothetical protein